MDANNKPGLLNDPALAYAAEPGVDEVEGMPGWTLEALQAALIEGEESGSAGEWDFEAFMAEIGDDEVGASMNRLDDEIDVGLASGEALPFDMANFLAAKRASVSETTTLK